MVTEWSRDGHNRPGFKEMAALSLPASGLAVTGSPGYAVTMREAANQSSEPRVGGSRFSPKSTCPNRIIEAQPKLAGPHRYLVGEPRFELGASSSRTKRATVLRYSPIFAERPKFQRFGCADPAGPHRYLVGVPGLEPGASCSQSRRATELRYTPLALF